MKLSERLVPKEEGGIKLSERVDVFSHIYGDILRSKKTLGWRTMLVVPELEMELRLGAQSGALMVELQLLRNQRDHYDERIQRLWWDLHGPYAPCALHPAPACNLQCQ